MSNPPPATDRRALLQNALQSLDEMQAKLDAAERARQEPIAIIGMGCRFPGDANSPEEYWRLLRDGIDAVSELPEERGALVGGIDDLVDPKTLQGGFLRGIDGFDPHFFGMSPREATSLDPQQRMMLEVCWEALERAGIAPDSLAGSATGVFVGITTNDYGQLLRRDGMALDVYAATGSALNAAPGRVAYTLGLQGPALAVDSACSSSLVAVHLAVQSLRSGESNLALAGGVNATLMPDAFVCFTRWGMLAADGRCKAFDASADGFVRGEGCGVVALRRLADAQADGDPILAVIRGTASNQDGRSAGLTVPSGGAQRAVIQAAMEDARVEPARVQYVEAHGTGTSLGDPIEVEAIGGALSSGRGGEIPLYLGSVKTNFGHLESAAGIAGLIKVVLMFQHGQIPPHLHLNERNPNIPWPDFPIEIPTALSPWPDGDGPRLAGVSGFGLSGTNAHVVLEGAPAPASVANVPAFPRHPLVLSARDAGALRDIAGSYAGHLRAHPEVKLADVAATASQGRAHLPLRLALSAATIDEAAEKLSAFAGGQTLAGLTTGQAPLAGKPRPAFLFTGQGAQYAGMGRDLYKGSPVYRDALDRCAAILAPYLGRPLLEVLFAEPETPEAALLNQTSYTQPALFAFEYALAALWESWGVRPAAVAGHSLGEYVAACVAGVLSLEDALTLVAIRGRLMGALPAGGAMAAVFAPEAEVRQAIAPYGAALSVAAINGPEHTVISGEAPAVESVTATLTGGGSRVQALTVSHAFHSALMEPILDEFEEVARRVSFRAPRIPFLANLTGEAWTEGEVLDAGYWRRHLREPVQFAATLNSMHAAGHDLFLEIGPHPVLAGMGRARSGGAEATWLPSLRRGRDEWTTLLDALGGLFVAGVDIDWKGVTGDYAGRRVDLPTYPFQHQRYWTAAATRRPHALEPGLHPLLGRRLRSPLVRSTLYEASVSEVRPAYLGDHRIFGTAIFPGSAFIEMALAAGADSGANLCSLDHMELKAPFALPSDESERLLQLALTPGEPATYTFEIASLSPDGDDLENAVTHAAGVIRTVTSAPVAVTTDPASLAATLPEEVEVDEYYARLAAAGLDYGPAFRGLTRLRCGDGVAVGFIQLPATIDDHANYRIHPAQLDACFHVIGRALPADVQVDDAPHVPVELHGLRLYRSAPVNVWCIAELLPPDTMPSGSLAVRLCLYTEDGEPVAEVERLILKRVPEATWARVISGGQRDWFYRQVWHQEPVPALDTRSDPGGWLIFADGSGLGDAMAQRLTDLGASATVVTASVDGAEKSHDNQVAIDPTDPDAPRRLLAALPLDQPLRGVAFLWGLDTPDDPLDGAALPGALRLSQALAALPGPHPRLWLVTSGAVAVDGDPAPTHAPSATLWGFGRTLAIEQPGLGCTCLDLDPIVPADPDRIVETLLLADAENQIALRRDRRYVARLEREALQTSSTPRGPYQLHVVERGNLDRLSIASKERRAPGPGDVEVEVRASGLNFRDVLNVLGMYPGEPGPPGSECAGTITAVGAGVGHLCPGDDVVALGSGCFDSHVIIRADLAFPKPPALSFAEAAAVPSAYLAAAYGLLHLADLQPGERVLIHAAAGGVGLAAVHIAMSRGAEVFATAGSPAKRAFLADLGVRNIFNSRTLEFADEILVATGGTGVDVVLNSLTDDFIKRSLAVLGPDGRFLELGKRGVWSPEDVAAIRPTASYHVYDLGEVLQAQPGLLETLLRDLLESIAEGRLPLVPVRAFPAGSIVDAFRHMAQARQIGKVVVTHRPEKSRAIRSDSSYLITGGMGGLGLETARWLVERGAPAVALLGRNEPKPDVRERISELERAGARVLVLRGDVSHAPDVSAALEAIDRELPPLRGVFHAAGATDDGELSRQTWSRFANVLAAKAAGGLHLHRLTKRYDLDHFVLFSSASAVLGSAGQSAYTAANAVLDALAHQRHEEGLPGLSINWGAWEGVGMAAGLGEAHRKRLSDLGMGTIAPSRGLAALETALGFDSPNLVIMPIRWDVLARHFGPDGAPPLLRNVLVSAAPADPASELSISQVLADAAPDERGALICDYLRGVVSSVLGLASSEIDPDQPLTELGLDSLMAVEVRNSVSSGLRIALSPVDVLGGASTRELATRVSVLLAAEEVPASNDLARPGADSDAAVTADLLASLDELSDDQVEALLNQLAMEDQRDDVSDLTVGRA